MNLVHSEKARARAVFGAGLLAEAVVAELAAATSVYGFTATGPVEEYRDRYVRLRDRVLELGIQVRREPHRREELRREAAFLRERLREIPQEVKWVDEIHNVVCTEGKNAALTHMLKGSTYTAAQVMGLIEDAGYGFAGANGSGVAATNLMGSVTAAAGASPANGWNEAQSSSMATRGTPAFGTASAGALALSSALVFNMLATDTIKGAFLGMRSAAGTAPTTTVGNTSGAFWSAGLFSGGDKPVGNGDSLSVSYSTSL
jgi:hypothetical protein